MILVADLDCIAANAAHAKAVAAGAGCEIVGVIKDAYAKMPILRAFLAGGVSNFGFSSPGPGADALLAVPRAQRALITPSLIRDADGVAANFATSTHSAPTAIDALTARIEAPHSIHLALRTNDDREGFKPDDTDTQEACVAAAAGRVPITGVLANFGCRLERAPAQRQIDAIYRAADAIERLTGSAQCVSLGGSVLLDRDLRSASHRTVLRIGEAIIAGTIPGRTAGSAFQAPFLLQADVLESRAANARGAQRILINAGWTHFDPADAVLDHGDGRIVHASAECSVVELTRSPALRAGDQISISLGYKSILRANLNPATQIVWRSRHQLDTA